LPRTTGAIDSLEINIILTIAKISAIMLTIAKKIIHIIADYRRIFTAIKRLKAITEIQFPPTSSTFVVVIVIVFCCCCFVCLFGFFFCVMIKI